MKSVKEMLSEVSKRRMLTQATARRWVTALRSGKYKQGKNRLATTELDGSMSYCCLGVLRELRPNCDSGSKSFIDTAVIPDPIQSSLARLNDNKGWSFNQIAGYIERYITPHLPTK